MIGRHLDQSEVRRDILFLLFLDPKERCYLRQIAEITRHHPGPIGRELSELAAETLVLRFEVGKQVFFQANWKHASRNEIVAVAQKDLNAHGGKPPWEREPEWEKKPGRGRPKAKVIRGLEDRAARLEKENALLKTKKEELELALAGAQSHLEGLQALVSKMPNQPDKIREDAFIREAREDHAKRMGAMESALAQRDALIATLQRELALMRGDGYRIPMEGLPPVGTAPPAGVPARGEKVRYYCPNLDCRYGLEAPVAAIHQTGRCPKCQRTHSIPSANER